MLSFLFFYFLFCYHYALNQYFNNLRLIFSPFARKFVTIMLSFFHLIRNTLFQHFLKYSQAPPLNFFTHITSIILNFKTRKIDKIIQIRHTLTYTSTNLILIIQKMHYGRMHFFLTIPTLGFHFFYQYLILFILLS